MGMRITVRILTTLPDFLDIVTARNSFGSDSSMVRPQIVQVPLRTVDGVQPRGLDNIEENLDGGDPLPLAQIAQIFPRKVAKKSEVFLRRNCSQIGYKVLNGSFVVFIIEHCC